MATCPLCDHPDMTVDVKCPDCGRTYEGWEWAEREGPDVFPATTNPDGSLTLVGYALHPADDLEHGGFDGIDTSPIDAALILADALRALVDAWPGGDDK